MIQHVAIFRWKAGTTAEQIAAASRVLNELPSQIDVLRGYTAQPNLHVRPGGADFGVVALVERAEDVDTYLDHPAHKAAVEQVVGPLIAERTAVQLPA